MNADVLRQLIWRHESKLHALTQELLGPSGVGTLRNNRGQLLWCSRPELVPEIEPGPADHPTGTDPEAPVLLAEAAISTEMWTIPIGEYGRLELFPDPDRPAREWAAAKPATSAGTSLEAAPGLLGPFGERLQALGNLLAVCLESEEEFNQLVEDHISNTNQLVALYNIISRTHETWEVGEKLLVMIEEAGRQTGASLAAIRVETETFSGTYYWPTSEAEVRARADRLMGQAREAVGPVAGQPPDFYASVPIKVEGQAVGWMVVGDRFTCEAFQTRDLKLLGALAELTAGFLLTSRLQEKVLSTSIFQRELSIAADIQDMLMPRMLPDVAGLDLAATCVPAQSVGGDFYVVQKLPEDRCAFAIGDVTGKGVPAALIMAMTRTVFRSLGSLEMGPREILQRLSEVLFDDLEGVGKFVTMIIGTYDLGTRRIEIANAGHSPVLYSAGPDDPFQSLEPPLPPLGVVEDMNWEPLSLEFPPGAMLVLSSDGITEARNVRGEMFEEQRLQSVLYEHRNADAAAVLGRVIGQVGVFSRGARQFDDQTLLICKGRV